MATLEKKEVISKDLKQLAGAREILSQFMTVLHMVEMTRLEQRLILAGVQVATAEGEREQTIFGARGNSDE